MAPGPGNEGLSRSHRFSGRGAFSPALSGALKFRSRMAILHVATGRPGQSRFGLAIPKRLARHSTDRNRIKRLAREVFRRHAAKNRGLDLVITLRQPFSADSETAWCSQVEALLAQACGGA